MAKEEWGVKRTCPETGKRFYDLNKDPVTSPYTGTEYPLSHFTSDKSKGSMSHKEDQSALKKAKDAEAASDVDVLDDEVDVLADEVDVADADLGDDVLDDDDDTVPLEELADVPATNDDEN